MMIDKILRYSFVGLVSLYIGLFIKSVVVLYSSLSHTDFVISRYKESLDYLHNPIFRSFRQIYVYNKGPEIELGSLPDGVIVRRLPNVGCEGHTYLEHMLHNTDRTCEKTIFAPGSWFSTPYKQYTIFRMMYLSPYRDFIAHSAVNPETLLEKFEKFSKTTYQHSHHNNTSPTTQLALCADRPYGKWYEKRFQGRTCFEATYSGLLLISQDLIESNPKELYSDLQSDLAIAPNPEVGHYMERSWGVLFSQ